MTAYASWSLESRNYALQYPESTFPNDHSFTVWAVAREKIKSLRPHIYSSVKSVRLKTHFSQKGYINSSIHIQKRKKRKIKADLIYLLPGFFSNATNSMNMLLLSIYAKQGYHVATASSSWSLDFLKKGPLFYPGDLITEAKLYNALLPQIRKKIGSKYIKKIHLVGTSYSATLVPIMVNLDLDQHLTSSYQTTTMLGPVSNISYTYKFFDHWIKKLNEKTKCARVAKSLYRLLDFAFAKSSSDISPLGHRCAKYLYFYHGFRKNFDKAIRKIHFSLGPQKSSPLYPMSRKQFRHWRRKKNYSSYLENYSRIAQKLGKERMSLSYWIEKLEQKGYRQYRILTSYTDPLVDLEALKHPVFTDDNLIILKRGGHLAYRSLPWFQKFIKLSLK